MLAVRSVTSLPRLFQGRGGLGDMSSDIQSTLDNLGSGSTIDFSGSNVGVVNPISSCDINFCTPTGSANSTGIASLLTSILPGALNLGNTLAKNLTAPYSTYAITPQGTFISTPGGAVSPAAAGALGLSSFSGLGGMLPLLLIGGFLLIAVGKH